MNEIDYISISEAGRITGLSFQTIRKYGDQAKIKCYKTPSGHRRFNKQDLERLCGCTHDDNQVPKIEKKNFIYTRVSSKNQLDDLSRQVAYIEQRRTPESQCFYKDLEGFLERIRKGSLENIYSDFLAKDVRFCLAKVKRKAVR